MEFPPDMVRDALKRLLTSSDFRATERLRQFLRYVVEETLEGRSDRIRAYTIGTSVFGRNESFDPMVESIVRTEAGRLRQMMQHYYLTSGRDDPVQVLIPVGSYVPIFVGRDVDAARPALAKQTISKQQSYGGPAILVEPFEQEGDAVAHAHFAAGLTQSLVVRLTRFTGFRVFFTGSRLENGSRGQRPVTAPDYFLRGVVTLSADSLGIEILLLKAETGHIVWADSFDSALVPNDLFSLKDQIANRVAQIIAQPYGMIAIDTAKDSDGDPPSMLSSYSCVLYFYKYWRTFDRDMIGPARECLERTIHADPNYAEAPACLSLVYSNAYRFNHAIGPVNFGLRERALELADRAIELAPSSSWSHYARSLAYWLANDVTASIADLETGRRLNPNDTTILAELGLRYAFRAQWEKALPLLQEAFDRNPAQPGWYHVGIYLYHLAHRRFEDALHEARRIQAPQILYGHVAIAIAAAELGRRREAEEAVNCVLAIDPFYGDRITSDLTSRNLDETLIELTLDGLRKAGLTGRDVERFAGLMRQA